MTSKQTDRLGTAPEEGVKAPVTVASTTNLVLQGLQVISDLQLVAGNRVLVKDQTTKTENGIYNVNASLWTRSTDWNKTNDVVAGQLIVDAHSGLLYRTNFSGTFVMDFTDTTFIVADPDSISLHRTTTAIMTADTTIQLGDIIHTNEFSTGNGGGGTYDVVATSTVTPNTANIIIGVADPDISFVLRIQSPQDVAAFGNSSVAVAAMDGVVKWGVFTHPSLTLDTAVVFSNPIKLTGAPGHKIIPSLGLSGGKAFAFETDDVEVDGLMMDAAGETFTPAIGNTYALFGGDGTVKYYNHRYINNKILNMSFSDGNEGDGPPKNLLVSHAIYVDNVDDVVIEDNIVDTISGSCVFLRDNHGISVCNNRFEDMRWYPINLTFNVQHWVIDNNQILSGTTQGVYWGGAINVVSDIGEIRVQHGEFTNNYITGAFSYGAVIRIQSGVDIKIAHNELKDITVGTLGSDMTGIAVTTRGISSVDKNSPSENIIIEHNILHGIPDNSPNKANAIKVDNLWWPATELAKNIIVRDNQIFSPDTSSYWGSGIIFHGFTGGFQNVWVENNHVETYLQASPTVGGSIGFTGTDANGLISKVYVGGNVVEDIGTPASAYQYGLGFNAYVDEVVNTKPNHLKNLFYGVRTLANSGPTLERIDDQIFNTCTTNELFAVKPSLYARFLEASTTYDPPSLADGAVTFKDITVTGATLGDFVSASFSLDNAKLVFSGYVRVTNGVRVILENHSGGVVDLAEGTLSVRVHR